MNDLPLAYFLASTVFMVYTLKVEAERKPASSQRNLSMKLHPVPQLDPRYRLPPAGTLANFVHPEQSHDRS